MVSSRSTLLFSLFSLVSSHSQPFLPSPRHLVACEPLCVSCDSSGKCISCSYDAQLSAGKCTCDPGYYANKSSCDLCPAACATCTKSDTVKCSECSDLAGMNEDGECYCLGGSSWNIYTRTCQCSTGYYFSVSQECLQCTYRCNVCEGSGAAQCIVCESGLFPSNEGCIVHTYSSYEEPTDDDDDDGTSLGGAIGGAIGGIISFAIVGGCAYYWWNRCKGTLIGALIIST